MKKVVYRGYGDANQLQIIDTEKPTPRSSQVLIKMKASAVNPIDWKIRNGELRLFSGWRFPKGVGFDFAGIVEAKGTSVTALNVGDEVFGSISGFNAGALAEYIVIDEIAAMRKPAEITFEQASALSMTGATALRILEDVINLRDGTEILINGATGGVGMFLTQLAKRKGAIVTAVASTRGTEALKQWGCDCIIDYTKENPLELSRCFDVVVDLSGKLPFYKAKKVMKDLSIYVNAIPTPLEIIVSKMFSRFSKKKNKALVTIVNRNDLQSLASHAKKGIDIRISKTYPLISAIEGYSYAEKHSALGKIVFVID